MNKLFWLTSTAMVCCCFALAQQPANDTTANLQLPTVSGKDSLFADFTYTVKEQNKIWLRWKIDSVQDGDFFVIERSYDGNRFETVSAIKGTTGISDYELTDNAPVGGHNFYRVHYTRGAENSAYSKILQADLFHPGFKFYPNPVDKLLIIQSDHSADMQIVSQSGAVFISTKIQSGMQVINVSALEKGTYLLRVTDKGNNRDIIQQLLKN